MSERLWTTREETSALAFGVFGARLWPRMFACLWIAVAVSCANVGKFVWVEDYQAPPGASDKGYVIGVGDIINVRVFNQESMSASRARVRTDGKVSLPLLNDVEAAGFTPPALAQRLQVRLKEYVKDPVVTVSIEESRQLSISVLGNVGRQGVYQVEPGTGILQILAVAGGLNEEAHSDRIFVLRQGSAPVRIRFRYESLAHAEGPGGQFRLQGGDIVVVE